MRPCAHPEVLAHDWLPPVPIGRFAEVAEVVRQLDPPQPVAPPPWVAVVTGPSGSGTSLVARAAARETANLLRASRTGGTPRILAVRTAGLRGTHGVASALLRRLDDGFDGRGFPVAEILAGLLRRLRREARAVLLVLDDIGVGGPDLVPILRAVGNPDRFLPEGEVGLPPIWTILAGSVEALRSLERAIGTRTALGPFLSLRPYSEKDLEAIVRDRVVRALGTGGTEELVHAVVCRALEDGGGAARALDLLRRRLAGVPTGPSAFPITVRGGGVPVESEVVRAIEAAVRDRAAPVGEVRRYEAELARARGSRPLPATTLWRRIVQLERAGYLRREIRPGGTGGTRSIVRLLAPVDEWVTLPLRPGSPRDDARPALAGEERRVEEGEFVRSVPLWPTPDDRAD